VSAAACLAWRSSAASMSRNFAASAYLQQQQQQQQIV
jgi:hypothetical protein